MKKFNLFAAMMILAVSILAQGCCPNTYNNVNAQYTISNPLPVSNWQVGRIYFEDGVSSGVRCYPIGGYINGVPYAAPYPDRTSGYDQNQWVATGSYIDQYGVKHSDQLVMIDQDNFDLINTHPFGQRANSQGFPTGWVATIDFQYPLGYSGATINEVRVNGITYPFLKGAPNLQPINIRVLVQERVN